MTVLNANGESAAHTSLKYEILSAAQLQERFKSKEHQSLAGVGVRLTVEDSIEGVVDYVPHVGLIDLVFSQFKDGRPFSTAVTLRRDYMFAGDLRASGDILPDQVLFLLRSGFSSFVVPEQFTAAQFKASLQAYSFAYQPMHAGDVEVIGDVRFPSGAEAAQ